MTPLGQFVLALIPSLEAQSSGGRHGELWAAGTVAVRVVELTESEGAVREDLVAADKELGARSDLAPIEWI